MTFFGRIRNTAVGSMDKGLGGTENKEECEQNIYTCVIYAPYSCTCKKGEKYDFQIEVVG